MHINHRLAASFDGLNHSVDDVRKSEKNLLEGGEAYYNVAIASRLTGTLKLRLLKRAKMTLIAPK